MEAVHAASITDRVFRKLFESETRDLANQVLSLKEDWKAREDAYMQASKAESGTMRIDW